MRCMWIRIPGRQIEDFEKLSTRSVTGWGGWCSEQRWRVLRSLLSVSVGRRCTCSFVSPVYLEIVCGAIVASKAPGLLVLTKLSRVSFCRSLHIVMRRKLNTLHLLFSDISVRFLDQVSYILHCGAWKPSFGHFGHVQGQVHIELFQLYTTSLRCHCSRHDEYLQEISCCFKQWDAAITSIIYAFIASCRVINACFAHSLGRLS